MSLGDPRGELIVLARKGDPRALSRIASVLHDNRASWLDGISEEGAKIHWRYGFIDGATLDARLLDHETRARLLDLPAARFLTRLSIFGVRGEGFERDLAAIATQPRAVRELTLTSRACEVTNLAPALAALPALRSLKVAARDADLTRAEHPTLRALSLFLTRQPKHTALAFPRLSRLTLSVRQIARDDFPDVIHGLPALRELHITGRADEFCAQLIQSPGLTRLEELTLHKCGAATARAVLSRSATLTQIDFKMRRPAVTRELYQELLDARIDVAMWNQNDHRDVTRLDHEFNAHEEEPYEPVVE